MADLHPAQDERAVNIARCPEHGLHGERAECFVCGGPVEQVPMVPAEPIASCDDYSLGFGEGWRTARGMDGEPDCWEHMIERGARAIYEMTRGASLPGVVNGIQVSHVGGAPLAEAVLRAALEMGPSR